MKMWGKERAVFVHAGVFIAVVIWMAVRIISSEFVTLRREFLVRGKVITEDKPLFMEAAAVLHAIRSL